MADEPDRFEQIVERFNRFADDEAVYIFANDYVWLMEEVKRLRALVEEHVVDYRGFDELIGYTKDD